MMPDATVGFGGKKTLGLDLSQHLAAAGRTIASATVTTDLGTVSSVSNTTTQVIFRFDAPALSGEDPLNATVLVTPTYDNGDIDPRWKHVLITRPG